MPPDSALKLLKMIKDHIKREKLPPTKKEMMEAIGTKSRSYIDFLLNSLETHGNIRRKKNCARGIILLDARGIKPYK